jgi:hypothetical protein
MFSSLYCSQNIYFSGNNYRDKAESGTMHCFGEGLIIGLVFQIGSWDIQYLIVLVADLSVRAV